MEMKSTGIPRKSHDAHRPRGERYETGLLGWGPFRKGLVQAKGSVFVHRGTTEACCGRCSETPGAIGQGWWQERR